MEHMSVCDVPYAVLPGPELDLASDQKPEYVHHQHQDQMAPVATLCSGVSQLWMSRQFWLKKKNPQIKW